ncbi:hypothetical protein L1049_015673 [Liquidambar formosana]|uniref:Cupin type-1 domain-containing protein n=1 Tax=Liquidambar formosana TaxID=63359 RepID=A0AAP0X6Q1_LIQFO
MELNLSPKTAQKLFEGDGGSYYSWSSSDFPLLRDAKVGAGKLVLQPRGFALPHYADSSKIGYVLQGSDGRVGMIFPNTSEEVVLNLKKGDTIQVPSGAVSWWYNDGDSELAIVFLGETSKAHVPGDFTYFFLTGGQGILAGFSTDIIIRTYNMDEEEATKLAKSQTGVLIVKLEKGRNMPQPCKGVNNKLIFNIDDALPDINVKGGGTLTTLTAAKVPSLGEIELSANLEKLDANALSSPIYTTDSAVQVTYVARGSGRIQIVGIDGKRVLDTKVKAGVLFVVPRFFVVAKVADAEGMECFSVMTTSQPVIEQLSGKISVWKALSPVVLQASLNVTAEFEKNFISKVAKSPIIIPPTQE